MIKEINNICSVVCLLYSTCIVIVQHIRFVCFKFLIFNLESLSSSGAVVNFALSNIIIFFNLSLLSICFAVFSTIQRILFLQSKIILIYSINQHVNRLKEGLMQLKLKLSWIQHGGMCIIVSVKIFLSLEVILVVCQK